MDFNNLIKKIFELPLWIKQIIYLELKEEFEQSSSIKSLNFIKKEDSLQLYKPKVTFAGKKELETKQKNLPENVYKFLEDLSQDIRIIEIAINNGWTLTECSGYFMIALNNELASQPESQAVKGTALYMSGSIRIGEFLVKIGKISIEQLDEALRNQKYIEESIGEKPGLAEILINMNFITKADTEGIILLKEEAKKRYIPGETVAPKELSDSDTMKLGEQISLLTRENNQLKDQIKKILKI